jgi:PPOX class probable F420-dependent enzyme
VLSLSDPQVRAFLTEGTRTGKLSYTSASGQPLVVPVWFVLEGDELVFNTGKDTAKGRALARDPRTAVCVDREQPPYAFIQVQGVAELSEDPAELVRTATAIGARYMGPERAVEFGQRNGVPGELVVRICPHKVLGVFDMTG